jgi:hypothetical protein
VRCQAWDLAVAHLREQLELQVQEGVDVRERVDQGRAHSDDAGDQVGAAYRERAAEHSAAALSDDCNAAAGLDKRALEALFQPLGFALGAVHVRRDAGAPRGEAVALEPARQEAEAAVGCQQPRDQEDREPVARIRARLVEQPRLLQRAQLTEHTRLAAESWRRVNNVHPPKSTGVSGGITCCHPPVACGSALSRS